MSSTATRIVVISSGSGIIGLVEANSTNIFKNRLDKHWYNEDIKYNWKTELNGTGSSI